MVDMRIKKEITRQFILKKNINIEIKYNLVKDLYILNILIFILYFY